MHFINLVWTLSDSIWEQPVKLCILMQPQRKEECQNFTRTFSGLHFKHSSPCSDLLVFLSYGFNSVNSSICCLLLICIFLQGVCLRKQITPFGNCAFIMQCMLSSTYSCTHAGLWTSILGPELEKFKGCSARYWMCKEIHTQTWETPLLGIGYATYALIFTQTQSVQYLFEWVDQWTGKQHWKNINISASVLHSRCHMLHWSASAANSKSHHKAPGSLISPSTCSPADNTCCHCVKMNRGLTEDGWVMGRREAMTSFDGILNL